MTVAAAGGSPTTPRTERVAVKASAAEMTGEMTGGGVQQDLAAGLMTTSVTEEAGLVAAGVAVRTTTDAVELQKASGHLTGAVTMRTTAGEGAVMIDAGEVAAAGEMTTSAPSGAGTMAARSTRMSTCRS